MIAQTVVVVNVEDVNDNAPVKLIIFENLESGIFILHSRIEKDLISIHESNNKYHSSVKIRLFNKPDMFQKSLIFY